ncbi:uncharacterized protein LOC131957847 [Physella acuta]|uniref:uncharacterized protein LOC131957847 n=1 Tax=Physella acuta TaxID=109671 RepID=UPI0027DE7580|nr:uncharacterized protein LOC131957847 [Physella acuta]
MSVMEDGAWTGMVPISCYFSDVLHFYLPRAKLNITQYDDSGDLNSVHLSFRQECSLRPNQFMAKYFLVFSTSSPNCDNERHIIANLSNKIFDDVHTEIPKDSKFVCIEAVGQKNVSDVFGPIIIIHGDVYKKHAIILGIGNAFFLISVIIISRYFSYFAFTLGRLNREEHQLSVMNSSMTSLENVSTTSMDTLFNVNADNKMLLNPGSRSLLSGSIEDNIHVINESVSGSDSESDSKTSTDI